MNTQNKRVFSTQNFSLATFLKAKQCELLRVTKGDAKHAIFEFEGDSSKLELLVKDFLGGKGLVEPTNYYNCQKELKTYLYDNSYLFESKS